VGDITVSGSAVQARTIDIHPADRPPTAAQQHHA
jgi:hypothetical protein